MKTPASHTKGNVNVTADMEVLSSHTADDNNVGGDGATAAAAAAAAGPDLKAMSLAQLQHSVVNLKRKFRDDPGSETDSAKTRFKRMRKALTKKEHTEKGGTAGCVGMCQRYGPHVHAPPTTDLTCLAAQVAV